MKYLCVDFGSKKVGFAQSDDDGRIAFPLMIAPNDKNLLKDTVELVRELKISTIVFGESVDGNGKPNAIAKDARKFALEVEHTVDVGIIFQKEWFSTTEARKQPGQEDNHEVDDAAAAIILQRYLDKVNGPGTSVEESADTDDEEGETTGTETWA